MHVIRCPPQIPFSTLLSLLCMWFGISLPLVLCGFYFGYRKQPYDIPVRTNQIPRQVPDQVWYLKPVYRLEWKLISSLLIKGCFSVAVQCSTSWNTSLWSCLC